MRTFGTAKLVTGVIQKEHAGTGRAQQTSDEWHLEVEPHVAIKLKRVFGRIGGQYGTIKIRDSDEVCRDLSWFIQRYPLAVDDVSLAHMTREAEGFDERSRGFEMVLSGAIDPRPFDLAIPLRDYQKIAAELALRSPGLLIADDVGLGKSADAIGMLSDPSTRPALVVTLTHLPTQWEREIMKFAPELRVHILKKGTPYDIVPTKGRQLDLLSRFPDVIITNYHKLAGWSETLAGTIKTCIFDEIQEFRRSDSNKYRAGRNLADKSTRRLGLSATPVYNYGGEMFNVMQILRPDKLGTWPEFSREWVGSGYADSDKAIIKDPKALGTYLREQGMMIRRTRAEVGRELPPLIKIPHHVESDPAALERISKDIAELARMVLSAGTGRSERWTASGELDWRLRQATGIAKAPYVADFVRMLIEGGGGKILLYGWHRNVYDIWNDKLKDLRPAMYTGTESPKQKNDAFDRFTKGDAHVLIMSLRAGAGLDGLQGSCNNVVFGELDWSPGVHEQCLSADTEILTPDGFRGPDAIQVGDLVAAFELSDGTIQWVPALAKTDRGLDQSEAMYACRTEKFDLRVTGQHRMVVRRKRRTTRGTARSGWEIALAADLDGSSRRFVPVSGLQRAPGVALTDHELRLLGWYITDGYFDGSELHLYQAASQPWNVDLVEVLNGCGLGWSLFRRHNPSGTLMNIYSVSSGLHPRWSASDVASLRTLRATGKSRADTARVLGRSRTAIYKKERAMAAGRKAATTSAQGRGWRGLEIYFDKNLSPLLEAMTREQLRFFLRGVHMGDGNKSAKNVYRVTSTNICFLDRLQSLCVRRGFSANISTRKIRTRAGRLAYDIWIADACEASLARPEKPGGFGRAQASAGERVWCVTNVLGTLVVRRNGKVAVVGNCAGRVHRDGQPDSVAAYFLVSDSGSDPVIADVLGLKRQQSEAITDPYGGLIEKLDRGQDNVRRMAIEYLRQRGEALPKAMAGPESFTAPAGVSP